MKRLKCFWLIAAAATLTGWQAHPAQTKIVAWGDNTYGQTNIPTGLTNVVGIAQGGMHALALNGDSTVTAWGYNYTWTTPVTYEGQATPPPGLSNVVAISAGYDSSMALKNDGTVVFWGDTGETNLPAGLTNIVAISTASLDSMALRSDGTVIVWGSNVYGKTNVPPGVTNVIGVVAGGANNAVLLSNNTVVVWGWNGYYATNVPVYATNITAFALGQYHVVALRKDGTVVTWGYNGYGQTNIPAGLSNVVQVAAGDHHCLALKKDGTVVAWGYNNAGQCTIPSGLSNVVAISASRYQSLALVNNGYPWIAQQPLSQTVYSGMNASFNVQVIGSTNVSYQWCFNGTNIPGATQASLSLTNVQTTNSGNFSVIVSNSVGSLSSSNALFMVLDSVPIIVSQPTNQSVALKSNAVMTAVATGSLPLYYRWQFSGTNIAKATNVSFSLTNAQFTNSGSYSVVVSNAFGSVTGLVATLTVMDLGIALNATNLTWTTSSSYPWFPETATNHDGVAAAQSSSAPFPQYSTLQTGVTGPGTLTFWATQSSFFDFYRFSVSSSNPQIIYIPPFSQWSQVTVYLGPGPQSLQWQFQASFFGSGYYGLDFGWLDQVSYVPGATPAAITQLTADQFLPAATNVTFAVSAIGTPSLRYQWQFNGTNIANATGSSFSLTNIQQWNSGTYTVTVTNGYGTVSSNVNLTVLPVPPVILTQPTNQVCWIGSNASFQVAAQGSIPFTYQWQFNGTNIEGATNSTLSIANLQKTNTGIYQAVVNNTAGSTLSSNAQLWVVRSAVVAWGGNDSGDTNVAFNCIDPQVVTAGGGNAVTALAINGDQTVTGWGGNSYGQLTFPAGLTNVIAIGEENEDGVALRSDGTVMAWGANEFGQTGIPPRLGNVTRIAAGGWHLLTLDGDGLVHAFGYDNSGQVDVPAGLHDVVAIAAGMVHSLALTSDGTLVAWGDNSAGQTNVPAGLTNVLDIAASQYHNLVLKTDGTVFSWGGEATNVPAGLSNVVAIACAQYQCMALKNDGTAVIWGDNTYGQTNVPANLINVVGLGGGTDFSALIVNDGSPWIVRQPRSQTGYQGFDVTLGVTALGVPPLNYQWQLNGTNLDGATTASLALTNLQAGSAGRYSVIISNALGNLASAAANLTVAPASPNIRSQPASQSLLLGNNATFSVRAMGVMPMNYQWRFNGANIGGATSNSFCLTNAQMGNLGSYEVVVGNKYGSVTSSIATLTIAQIMAWGENGYGQTNVLPGLSNVVAISAGSYHVLALKNDGTVAAWGASTNNLNSIVDYGQATVPEGLSNVVAVAAGGFHSLAVKRDGTIMAWGYNGDGETNVPPGTTNVVAVAAGYNHSLALKADGTMIAWGLNNYGQTNVPDTLSNVVGIAAGLFHSVALKRDGTVVFWGFLNVAVPFPSGLSNVIAVAAGGYHSIALKNDGTVVCWGRNAEGESNVPNGLSNVVAVAGGRFHSMALKSDGSVVGWGYNNFGQTDAPRGLPSGIAISANGYFDVVLLNYGCPFLINPLSDQTIYTGQTATFQASALGSGPIVYQWQCGGNPIAGATNATLILTNAQPANSGIYRLILRNAYGTATNGAALTVLPFGFNSSPVTLSSATNGFPLQVDGVCASNSLIIFASTDLVSWVPIFTNGSAIGSVQFMDAAATNLPARFYRVMEQ